ncbi:short-chain dehydrogenase [Lysobacter xinjiangensis]|uniref:Short-chain dehydrogenase n=1 Tax=Cognatilysobacter xinjiangensis TaxID=546892 RepID=A0ABQ3C5J9_9GAMM|nr:SDR family oxidoreductase [Lysobacter xinjiangensis]GGZ69528.1 short-chain dehydrogenase [Lysobacter xinjiangensis]
MSRRNVLITGANRGIGLEYVRQLLARGDHVIATARHPAQAHDLNRLVAEHPGRLHVFPLDVMDPKAEAEVARELPLVLGDEPLHLLINNAGLLHSGERFGHVPAANLEDSFRTNAMGPFLLAQAIEPRLADGAKVANMTSQLGSIANTTRFGTPTYAIGKAALNMVTRLLAAALADRRIAVVSLHPGWVQTDMGGAQAPLAPQQSVAGLLRVIDGLDMARSGSFLDWQGETLPW